MNDDLKMKREDMKIEGDRNLYNYTFTDASGKPIPPEPVVLVAEPKTEPKDTDSKR